MSTENRHQACYSRSREVEMASMRRHCGQPALFDLRPLAVPWQAMQGRLDAKHAKSLKAAKERAAKEVEAVAAITLAKDEAAPGTTASPTRVPAPPLVKVSE